MQDTLRRYEPFIANLMWGDSEGSYVKITELVDWFIRRGICCEHADANYSSSCKSFSLEVNAEDCTACLKKWITSGGFSNG